MIQLTFNISMFFCVYVCSYLQTCLDELHFLCLEGPICCPLSLFMNVGEQFVHVCGWWSYCYLEQRG